VNHDGSVAFEEYVECRGYYDKMGNIGEINEFDVLENVVLGDYQAAAARELSEVLQRQLTEQDAIVDVNLEVITEQRTEIDFNECPAPLLIQ
jgi:hypothetical protein